MTQGAAACIHRRRNRLLDIRPGAAFIAPMVPLTPADFTSLRAGRERARNENFSTGAKETRSRFPAHHYSGPAGESAANPRDLPLWVNSMIERRVALADACLGLLPRKGRGTRPDGLRWTIPAMAGRHAYACVSMSSAGRLAFSHASGPERQMSRGGWGSAHQGWCRDRQRERRCRWCSSLSRIQPREHGTCSIRLTRPPEI